MMLATVYSVADMLTGFGNVAEDIAMDNSSEDEVNMADQDES